MMSRLIEKALYAAFPDFVHPCLKEVIDNKKNMMKKTANFLLNAFEKRLQRGRLLSYPYFLTIDPTNICNLKCPLCPTWQDSSARPKGIMDIGRFIKVMDEIGPYLFTVNLCNWGEPLLNPHLSSMIRYAKACNTVVGFSTNLNCLPDETARQILDSGIDIIVVSLDGASQGTYSKYRRGGSFTSVLANMERLLSYRRDAERFPLILWQFLVNRYNESEIDEACTMARKMGVRFLPSPMRPSMGKELLFPLYERVKEIRDWLADNPHYNRYNYEIRPDTRTRQTTCKWLWNSTVINWDGSVSPCCGVFEKKWDFQSCYDDASDRPSFRQVWNGPRYMAARRLVAAYLRKSKEIEPFFAGAAATEGVICAKCIRYGFLED
jgi:MoaA/NifB/PqqE/SkfB family radical SAM enzyme